MVKVLLVLLWPAGIAAIAGVAVRCARRAPALATAAGPQVPPRVPRRHRARSAASGRAAMDWLGDAVRLVAIVAGGSVVVLLITWLLGVVVLHAGPSIDKPFYTWTQAHRMHLWASVMTRATKIGDSQATWAAAGTAGACLAVAWRRRRWLPPVALVGLVAGQKLVVHLIHTLVHRVGPPDSPHGVFPSGGAARAIVIYGLIAYLLWREFGGTRRSAIWTTAAVATIGFNEGYSRLYLTLHWLTDVLSGWIYGGMLLVVYIMAVRLVAGPGRAQAGASRAARGAATPGGPTPTGPVPAAGSYPPVAPPAGTYPPAGPYPPAAPMAAPGQSGAPAPYAAPAPAPGSPPEGYV
jgi:membrane-associated phospholipid phosphatase